MTFIKGQWVIPYKVTSANRKSKTVVLHKYLNDKQKHSLLQFFLMLHGVPRWFPKFSKYIEIPEFPGRWPHCECWFDSELLQLCSSTTHTGSSWIVATWSWNKFGFVIETLDTAEHDSVLVPSLSKLYAVL